MIFQYNRHTFEVYGHCPLRKEDNARLGKIVKAGGKYWFSPESTMVILSTRQLREVASKLSELNKGVL